MKQIGFKKVKSKVIDCLKTGKVRHEQRGDIDIKNLLAIGTVTTEQVATAIARASGDEYECRFHHYDSQIQVHIIKTVNAGKRWYIKWYFIEPETVFISVHEQSDAI